MSVIQHLRFAHCVALITALFSTSFVMADQPGKSTKTLLAESDYPPGYKTTVFRTEIPAYAQAPMHQHPGIESGYVIEGGGTLLISGKPQLIMRPGMTTIVEPNTPHWFINGPDKTIIVSTYVVERDKPIMEVIKP